MKVPVEKLSVGHVKKVVGAGSKLDFPSKEIVDKMMISRFNSICRCYPAMSWNSICRCASQGGNRRGYCSSEAGFNRFRSSWIRFYYSAFFGRRIVSIWNANSKELKNEINIFSADEHN